MNVELKDIHKSFGPVHANTAINLNIPAGTIQGILGENGAGKSTLMKILSGFIQMDHGEILLDGHPVTITSPDNAIHHGIGMLHQDPLDFPPLRVIDNFILGQKGRLFPDLELAAKQFRELSTQFEFNIEPDAHVDSLTVGERQQLEILRLLWLGAETLILDEPTTGISAAQKTKLFATLKQLAKKGKTILFVSHKLEDVEELCDQVAVLRHGKLIGTTQPPFNTHSLVEMMFGKVIETQERNPCEQKNTAIQIRNLTVENYRLKIQNVSLEVSSGEVIGLAGMEGSGQDLFLRTLAGLNRPTNGEILLNEKHFEGRSHHNFKDYGTAFLPAARLEEGLVPGLNLTDHFALAEPPEGFFINWEKSRSLAEERIKSFDIRGTANSNVEALSGGNQQRALLALLREPLKLLLLEHPTRGLDIESAMYIWSKLKKRCQDGLSLFFISSDLEEILQYSDRILVFFSGRVSIPLDASEITSDKLGQLIGGKGWPGTQSGVEQL